MEESANTPVTQPTNAQPPGQSSQQPGPMSTNANTNHAQKTKNNTTPPSRNTIIFLSIISFLILLMVAMILFFPFSSLSRIQKSFKHVPNDAATTIKLITPTPYQISTSDGKFLVIRTNSNKFFAVTTPTSDIQATPINTFVKGSGNAAGYAVKVTKIILNPQVSGDPPDKGMQYLEVDLTISNSGNTTEVVPGAFLFRSSSGLIYTTADAKGTLPDNTGLYSNKNVSIPGKNPLASTVISSGQTIDVYQIYQIMMGDKGKLEWNDQLIPLISNTYALLALY